MEVFDASLWSMVCRTVALTSILANKISSIVWRNCPVQSSVSDLVEPNNRMQFTSVFFIAGVDSVPW